MLLRLRISNYPLERIKMNSDQFNSIQFNSIGLLLMINVFLDVDIFAGSKVLKEFYTVVRPRIFRVVCDFSLIKLCVINWITAGTVPWMVLFCVNNCLGCAV